MSVSQHLSQWTQATANLPWGVQQVLYETLTLVSEEKVTLVHGQDYREGSPCLINSVGQMLAVGGGEGIPSRHFGDLVVEFDNINRHLESVPGMSTKPGFVSPAMADVLLHHFAPLKDKPTSELPPSDTPYREPSDEAMREWLDNMVATNGQVEPEPIVSNENEPVEIKVEPLY